MRAKSCVHAMLLATAAAITPAHAQPAAAPAQPEEESAIIVTGTRATGLQATDSAAPVQILGAAAIARVGQPNLNQALTQIVPSFSAQTQGTDLSSFSLSARLRGLSPNHTLVLVNGKRRHGSAILQVIAGPFQGSAAPSIDLIPPDAVKRIEILQEGAAAIYGTDAIAGVINLILKDQDDGGTFNVTGGQYYDGQGDLFSVSGNVGFKVGDAGFVNLTAFHRRQDYTTQGTGQVQVTRPDGSLQPNAPAQWANLAGDALANINGGQPKSKLSLLFYNAGYDLGDVQLYSFGDISRRIGYAKQGYRHPKRICALPGNPNGTVTTTPYSPDLCFGDTGINGFVPLQNVEQDEYSVTGGARGTLGGWNFDAALTYGYDKNEIYTIESAHREIWIESYTASRLPGSTVTPNSPSAAYDGGFRLSQLTGTLDIRREIDVGFADPLTFAFGGEYRRDTYEIVAGDFFSTYKTGVQSFPGYKEVDAGKSARNAKAVYVNAIASPVEDWTIDLAGRYEDYSDVGDTLIGKLTTRYDFSDAFALRGTVSTGFRAPTLAEARYSTVNVAPTSAILQLPAGTPAARLLGFDALGPEKSTNISAGVVLRPIPRLSVTIDGYYIKIRDRIAGTAPRYAIRGGVAEAGAAEILSAIAAAGVVLDAGLPNIGVQSFTNGIDTRTWGVDFAARYPVALGFGALDLTLNANYNKTTITDNQIPAVFSAVSESYIEDASPRYKVVGGILFTSGRFSANLRETLYGKTSILVVPAISGLAARDGVVGAAAVTDLELDYDLTRNLRFAIGANNLFNKRPEVPKLLEGVVIPAGVSPYESGSGTYNSRYGHGAYGTAGGYYYARMSFTF